jgi:hypothetical protein
LPLSNTRSGPRAAAAKAGEAGPTGWKPRLLTGGHRQPEPKEGDRKSRARSPMAIR